MHKLTLFSCCLESKVYFPWFFFYNFKSDGIFGEIEVKDLHIIVYELINLISRTRCRKAYKQRLNNEMQMMRFCLKPVCSSQNVNCLAYELFIRHSEKNE